MAKCIFLIFALMLFFLAVPSAFSAGLEVWEVTPTWNGNVFGSADCYVATGSFCPKEMGWEGHTVYYIFNLPADREYSSKLKLTFNVSFRNWNTNQNVLLEISAGPNKSNLTIVRPQLEIDRLGQFSVTMNTSLFQKGAINYIKLYGKNISPIGYGRNPPNFQINHLSFALATAPPSPTISNAKLLDKTEAQAANYFYENALTNGLVKDTSETTYSSIAATGFGLTAFTIMAERYGTNARWKYTPTQLRARTNQILNTLLDIQSKQAASPSLYGKKGLFFHFIKPSGKAATGSEVSTVDSAILFSGVITAGEYFGGAVKRKADLLLSNADWSFYLKTLENDFETDNGAYYQFSHGWKPVSGMLDSTWGSPSDETLLVSLIALASNPDSNDFKKSFFSWPRTTRNYAGYDVVNSYFGSLFTYEFGHVWIDFNKIGKDTPSIVGSSVPAVDWWTNSINAAKAARQFAINNSGSYSSYGEDSWGFSACQSPNNVDYLNLLGSLPTDSGNAVHDGTIAVYSSIGTMPFFKGEDNGYLMSNLGFRTLRNYYDNYYWQLWGSYGPHDSFNKGSFSGLYLGIDQGTIVTMIENYRTGLVWEQFLKNSNVKAALRGVFECPNGACN